LSVLVDAEVRANIVHHGLLPVVRRKLVFVGHKLIARSLNAVITGPIRGASIRHRAAIDRDSAVYLHSPGLTITFGAAAAAVIRFLVQGPAECILVVGPFLFEQRFYNI
jgi:hypothetical protein